MQNDLRLLRASLSSLLALGSAGILVHTGTVGTPHGTLRVHSLAPSIHPSSMPQKPRGLALSAWPKAYGDTFNSGRGASSAATGQERWTFQAGGAIVSAPSIGPDGNVYLGSRDRKVYALNGGSGQKQWEYQTIGHVEATPAIGGNGLVYVGSFDGRLYALDTATGQPKWVYRAPGATDTIEEMMEFEKPGTGPHSYTAIAASPTIGRDGTVFVNVLGTSMGLTAFNGQTGRVRWTRNDSGGNGCPAFDRSGALIQSFHGLLRVIDAQTGSVTSEIDHFANADPIIRISGSAGAPAVGPDGSVYLRRTDERQHTRFYALDPARKQTRWTKSGGQTFGIPAIGSDGAVYVGRSDREDAALCAFLAIDGATGKVKWQTRLGPGFFGAPAMSANGALFVPCSNGTLYALDSNTGDVKWMMPLGTHLSENVSIGSDGTVYVGVGDYHRIAGDNRLVAVK